MEAALSGCSAACFMSESTTTSYLAAPIRAVDLGATRLAYRVFGSGDPLLLIHGFPLSGFTWRKVLPELARSYTCYVPDLAGMGETQWTDATDFTWHGHARTLKALIDHLDLDRYSVLAQDTGGTFARCLALIDAKRVHRLAIINSEIPHHRPPWIPLYQTLMALPGALAPFRWLLRSTAFLRSGMGFGGCFCDLRFIEGDFHEHVIAPLVRSPRRLEGLRRYLVSLKWDVVDGLATGHAEIAAPVKLIWGAEDPTFPVERARSMVQQFRVGSLVEIPGAKLLVHEERPADVARAAAAFLRN